MLKYNRRHIPQIHWVDHRKGTVSELRAMEQRFEVASLLHDGMIYNEILERTGASSATISRVNRSLSYGTGAYEKIFERCKGEKGEEK